MAFSWNKWRQYVIEEASVNEEVDEVGEILPFFSDAASMGIIRKVDAQRATEAGNNSEDLNAFESTQEFQQIGKEIIDAAIHVLEERGRETHYLYQKFAFEGGPIDGADISNAVNILRGIIEEGNPENEMSPEDTIAEDKFDKPGWDLEAIMDSFKEDFEEATRDTDDIPYAQSRVVDAYKDVFAKSHPQLAGEIDAYLNNKDAETRKMFQNVADDPEVVGRDMMSEGPMVATFNVGDRAKLIVDPKLGVNQPGEELKVIRVEPQIGGKFFNVQVQNSKGEKAEYDNKQLALVGLGPISRREEDELGGYQLGELEGEVQTEVDAFDEAINDMAIEKASTATKLDALQNDLEATLSQDEIDALSDAIVLLRKKENLGEALDSKALINILQALGKVEEEFGTKLEDEEAEILSAAADIIKNLAKK